MKRDDPSTQTKPFEIPKRLIWASWKHVAANKGAPGVDKEGIQAYQDRLGGNLYTLWNRMSSGELLPEACQTSSHSKRGGRMSSVGDPDGR